MTIDPPAPARLSVRSLARPGLTSASLDLAAGECMAVMGESGAGKTLLLRAIADLDPTTGTVSLDGHDRAAIPAPLWRQQVSYLASDAGWWAQGVAEHFADWNTAAIIAAAVGLTAEAGSWPVTRLSSGERQRLALVRTLANAPRVLLLDEPTANLDEASALAVERLLLDRLASGVAILMVTHNPNQARRMAQRLLIVDGGRVREEAGS
ncbi:MAG: ATP-binding cassette domain-containing protein [Alphaproteobacteria bacterium]|nr:ATP-binding cassette domain-containing protein [Alphaproteobacteria bacterium]